MPKAHKPKLTIAQQVLEFHRLHPEVYDAMCSVVDDLYERGFRHYSVQGVWELLRFNLAIQPSEKDAPELVEYKLNNNYSAYYARQYASRNPERKDFFAFRRLGAKGKGEKQTAAKATAAVQRLDDIFEIDHAN